MKVTFFSNYLNHHQYSFCREMLSHGDIDFTFVATKPMSRERAELGYKDMNGEDFVIREYEGGEQELAAERLCAESDVVIIGSAPEKYAALAVENGKLLLRYSERIFKKGPMHAFSPVAVRNIRNAHTALKNQKAYLLCAGAYAAADFNRMGAYRNKAYKWGYFPEVKKFDDPVKLIDAKEPGSVLWVGRFIRWKHPEIAVEVARKLKNDGRNGVLRMIGTGDMLGKIKNKIIDAGLSDRVEMMGAMPGEKVREYMEKSDIFLFTSDFNEGWGAVLNEAMNSCCGVIASHAIGAVPFLINNGENGIIYKNGNTRDLYKTVSALLDNGELRRSLQLNAYKTVSEEWNPALAAERLISLIETLLQQESCEKYESGPCSKAVRISNDWFR